MTVFYSINRTPACANKELLTDILRGDFGYKGLVISDNNAVASIVTGHHYVKDYYQVHLTTTYWPVLIKCETRQSQISNSFRQLVVHVLPRVHET